MYRAVVSTICAFLPTLAFAQTPAEECVSPTGRSISVIGSASVRLPPDRVSFTVGVETTKATVAEAFDANASKLNAVLAAVKKAGVGGSDIQTSHLEIATRDYEGKPLDGVRVSNLVTVIGKDPKLVGNLLQAAVSAGANQASGLQFYVADRGKVETQGLTLAFKAAQTKAGTLAGLATGSLGAALCVKENAGWSESNVQNNLAALGYVSGSPTVETGTEAITFSVSVVFAIE